ADRRPTRPGGAATRGARTAAPRARSIPAGHAGARTGRRPRAWPGTRAGSRGTRRAPAGRSALGFLAAHDRQGPPDLDAQRLALDRNDDLGVEVPADRTGRELALVRDQLLAIDDDLHRFGLVQELSSGDGAGCLGHLQGRLSLDAGGPLLKLQAWWSTVRQ